MFEVKVIADSISEAGKRVTTFQLAYQRFIHSEVKTHRMLSTSSMSSRAVPVKVMIDQVENAPAMPFHWGLNQPGMQASVEVSDPKKDEAIELWERAAGHAAYFAGQLAALGLAKQVANRLLEPFQWMRTVITATEWDNFYELRCHPDAQPEFHTLAVTMRAAQALSAPVMRPAWGSESWHLPYVTEDERSGAIDEQVSANTLARVSAARCARVSYLKHDGASPSAGEDLKLFERLAGSRPMHLSPLEHPCTVTELSHQSGNFTGWMQLRKIWEGSSAQTN